MIPHLHLICPACRGELINLPAAMTCAACGAAYAHTGGFPDLTVGGRFEDEPDQARSAYEERANEHTAKSYLAPAFRRLFPNGSPQILSVGCGTGIDVDVLAMEQFDAVGVDCGNRTAAWPRRQFPSRLLLANGMHLPFEDAAFDLAYCGCVFPHVGTLGDSNRVAPGHNEMRLKLAREMTRVVKPGGYILVSSPNRWCPVDIFHGRTPESSLPRLHPPNSRFLLSPGDYRRLFATAGCNWFQLLPVTGYWGFVNRRETWKGRALVWPVQQAFRLAAWEPLRSLRAAPFSPWLVMLIRKAA
jgi:SAM-dependent methyltransferase